MTKQRLEKLSTQSPLSYPGSKRSIASVIAELVPEGTSEMVSPFFGGGSVELACMNKGIRVYGYDIFTPVVEFWQEIVQSPSRLAEKAQQYFPLDSKDKFKDLREKYNSLKSRLDRAASFFVLNKSSFGGMGNSFGADTRGGNVTRFTQKIINKVRQFCTRNISVEVSDFRDSLKAHPNKFAYVDPPYYGKEKSCNSDKKFDHEALAKILRQRKGSYILSYESVGYIKDLYRDLPMIEYGKRFQIQAQGRKTKEVLIFSEDMAERIKGKIIEIKRGFPTSAYCLKG